MRTHEKVPRSPRFIATIISAGSIGIGMTTLAAIGVLMVATGLESKWVLASVGITGMATLIIFATSGWRALTASERYYNDPPESQETPMSAINGNEPDHWHDEHGHHRMKDPREVYGNHWKNQTGNWTDADERAYARHLIAHESLLIAPQPQPGDTEAILALVRAMQGAEEILRTGTGLIAALRQQQQQKEANE